MTTVKSERKQPMKRSDKKGAGGRLYIQEKKKNQRIQVVETKNKTKR